MMSFVLEVVGDEDVVQVVDEVVGDEVHPPGQLVTVAVDVVHVVSTQVDEDDVMVFVTGHVVRVV